MDARAFAITPTARKCLRQLRKPVRTRKALPQAQADRRGAGQRHELCWCAWQAQLGRNSNRWSTMSNKGCDPARRTRNPLPFRRLPRSAWPAMSVGLFVLPSLPLIGCGGLDAGGSTFGQSTRDTAAVDYQFSVDYGMGIAGTKLADGQVRLCASMRANNSAGDRELDKLTTVFCTTFTSEYGNSDAVANYSKPEGGFFEMWVDDGEGAAPDPHDGSGWNDGRRVLTGQLTGGNLSLYRNRAGGVVSFRGSVDAYDPAYFAQAPQLISGYAGPSREQGAAITIVQAPDGAAPTSMAVDYLSRFTDGGISLYGDSGVDSAQPMSDPLVIRAADSGDDSVDDGSAGGDAADDSRTGDDATTDGRLSPGDRIARLCALDRLSEALRQRLGCP